MSSSRNVKNDLYAHFNEFRRRDMFHDIIIKVADRIFPCHRIILASGLEYFRCILSADDGNKARKREIELKNVNADDFELVLTHVYGDSVTVDDTNVFRLLKLSHHLCQQNLVHLCAKYVVENIDTIPSITAINTFVFASQCGLEEITDASTVIKFLAENFAVECANLVTISSSKLTKILSHPNLDKSNLSVILDFLVDWVKIQSDEEKKMLPSLLDAMKLETAALPKEWCIKAIEALKLVHDNPALPNTSTFKSSREELEYIGLVREKYFVGALLMEWIWRNTISLVLNYAMSFHCRLRGYIRVV